MRTILGCFLFTGDDSFKKIKVLSGGEKARVALAKALVNEANFMLLDEPTNHLDIQSMNILIQALQQFEGTFITVSHDRYFISNIANKIWWIEEDQIKEYLGTYDEWKYFMQQREKNGLAPKPKQEKTINKSAPVQEINTADANSKLKKQLQKQADEVEQVLERFKIQKQEIEKQISDLNNQSKIGTLSEQYKVLEDSIVSKNKEFETIFEQLLSL